MSHKKIKIRISRTNPGTSDIPLPTYATSDSSEMFVKDGETALVPTGFSIEVPDGYEAQIRPRSGLALKQGITVLNSPGTIDSDYRGEVRIILSNFGGKDFLIHRGDRIAQMVIAPVVQAVWQEVPDLAGTKRGTGGFGHTGK
jgi:dUTP pyrophosphatase